MASSVPRQVSYDNEIEVITEPEANEGHLTVAVEDERSSSSVKSTSPEQNIASQPLTGGKKVVRTYSKSPHYLPLALIVCVINLPFGCLAAMFSILSMKHGRKESSRSATYAKLSLWLSLVGIACSIVVGIFITVYYLVIVPNIISLEEELQT
ncbi:hypothetical protein LOTGIDRAFT_163052 [Lottia gigantea]|uniref:Transmembrane protein 233 n=1 Tax=Lottia gigantea TaxID=225164 RepID=V3ZL10_LOTGI|nr:hypothetical protein LOTGIDRAFT_163052 [Lottia gigantea]ESO92048.1 hypothetical protein LOTGIDRAFT_163052 [Lottia gigantea]